MLINVGDLVKREMLVDACGKMTNSFANVGCIKACTSEFVCHTRRSPLGIGSFTKNKLLHLNALKTNLMHVDILAVAINKAAYLLLSNYR